MMQLEKFNNDQITQIINVHYQNGVRVRNLKPWDNTLNFCTKGPVSIVCYRYWAVRIDTCQGVLTKHGLIVELFFLAFQVQKQSLQ